MDPQPHRVDDNLGLAPSRSGLPLHLPCVNRPSNNRVRASASASAHRCVHGSESLSERWRNRFTLAFTPPVAPARVTHVRMPRPHTLETGVAAQAGGPCAFRSVLFPRRRSGVLLVRSQHRQLLMSIPGAPLCRRACGSASNGFSGCVDSAPCTPAASSSSVIVGWSGEPGRSFNNESAHVGGGPSSGADWPSACSKLLSKPYLPLSRRSPVR